MATLPCFDAIFFLKTSCMHPLPYFYLHFKSCYLKLLISQSYFSGTRTFTLISVVCDFRYQELTAVASPESVPDHFKKIKDVIYLVLGSPYSHLLNILLCIPVI